jgi:hypothetical protein
MVGINLTDKDDQHLLTAALAPLVVRQQAPDITQGSD